jgi:hypothetical protein
MTHKSALSFACPEHKCSNCQGTLEPKGHNRNDCPEHFAAFEAAQTVMENQATELLELRLADLFAH